MNSVEDTLIKHGIILKKDKTYTKIIDVLNIINKKHKKEVVNKSFGLLKNTTELLNDALRKRQKSDKVCIDCGKKFQVWCGCKRQLARRCIWCSQNHKNARGYKRKKNINKVLTKHT